MDSHVRIIAYFHCLSLVVAWRFRCHLPSSFSLFHSIFASSSTLVCRFHSWNIGSRDRRLFCKNITLCLLFFISRLFKGILRNRDSKIIYFIWIINSKLIPKEVTTSINCIKPVISLRELWTLSKLILLSFNIQSKIIIFLLTILKFLWIWRMHQISIVSIHTLMYILPSKVSFWPIRSRVSLAKAVASIIVDLRSLTVLVNCIELPRLWLKRNRI